MANGPAEMPRHDNPAAAPAALGEALARVRLRTFRRDDVDAVRALLWRVWEQSYTAILGPKGVERHCAALHTRGRLRALADDLATECNLVAEVDGNVVAFASAILGWSGAVDIYELYVDTPWQGQGIGTRLLEATFARFPGARVWRIEVLERNLAAIALYERHGFALSGSRPDWFQRHITVLKLVRPGAAARRYSPGELARLHLRSLARQLGILR